MIMLGMFTTYKSDGTKSFNSLICLNLHGPIVSVQCQIVDYVFLVFLFATEAIIMYYSLLL